MDQKLAPPYHHALLAAEGWLELGNPIEAAAELNEIPPDLQPHPSVLEIRWQIAAFTKKWEDGVAIAASLMLVAPENPLGWIHRSYALHELKRTAEARDNLLRVADKFPSATIRYNLACYECQLGRLEQARIWFNKALELGDPKTLRLAALRDPDLEPLWEELRS